MNNKCWYCGYNSEHEETHCPLCRRAITKDTSGKHVQAGTTKKNPIVAQAGPFINGETKVGVFRREVNERTGLVKVIEVKRGIIVSQGTSFARVYDNQPVQDGGDSSQAQAEKFPFNSPNCWIVPAGQLKRPIKLAPELQ